MDSVTLHYTEKPTGMVNDTMMDEDAPEQLSGKAANDQDGPTSPC